MSNNQTTNKPPRMRGHGPMGGGPGGRGPVEKAKDVKGTTKKLGQRLSSYKIAIIIVMIFAIGSTIFSWTKNFRKCHNRNIYRTNE